MAINLCCTNSNCKYYYEQMCSKNVHEEFMVISESGQCLTFEEGVSDWYEEEERNG